MKAFSPRTIFAGLQKAALLLMLAALGSVPAAHAQGGCDNDGCAMPAPEINSTDLSPLLSSVALLSGSVLVLRARYRRR